MIRSIAFNNLVLLVQYGVGSLVPLLLVPHIVHHVGLREFGSLAIALSLASFATVVVQFAFQLTGPRQLTLLANGDTQVDVVCRVGSAKLVLLGLVLGVLVVGIGLVHWHGHFIAGPQLWLLAALPIASALHMGWYLQAEGRFLAVSVTSILGAFLALAGGFVGLDPRFGLAAGCVAAFALSASPLLAGVATLWLSIIHLGRKAGNRPIGWRSPVGQLREGWPLFASQFAAALYGASGPLVVGALAGAEGAGAYGAVERVSGAIVGACMLTHTAAYPALVRTYLRDKRAYLKLMQTVVAAYLAIWLVVAAGCVLAWDEVLRFVLGDNGHAHGPLLVTALVWIALGVFGPAFTGYLTASGQAGVALPLTTRVLLLAVTVGVPGVMIVGAWAWLAALCVSQVLVLMAAARAWRTESSVLVTGES